MIEIVRTLWWLTRPVPTVPADRVIGRFTSYTPTAPVTSESAL